MPAPLAQIVGLLEAVAEAWREAREMERRSRLRWPHLDD
jgi:hypothetical protein